MPKKVTITPEVRAVLELATADGNVVRLNQPDLERGLYLSVDKVLKALGGKWDRRANGHVFPGGIAGQLSDALTAGVAVDQKRTAEQFFTPVHVARMMADKLDLPRRDVRHILEPSAGDGRLVQAAMEHGVEFITAVELDPALARGLAEMIGQHGGGVWTADFMTWSPVARAPIDAVMMNPPFGKRQDMAHVRRAFDFLRPGGVLVAVMSPHWTYASNAQARDFAVFVEANGGEWEALPEDTFKTSGTSVNAGILTIRKGASA